MAASTMRPVELYHDPSLDGLLGQGNSVLRNNYQRRDNFGHGRRPSSDSSNMSSYYPPAAPEVPRAPPISYRNSVKESGVPQRSFSQRAKGRPFAREAFAGDDDLQFGEQDGGRPHSSIPVYSRDYDADAREGSLRVDTGMSGERSVKKSPGVGLSPRQIAGSGRQVPPLRQSTRPVSDSYIGEYAGVQPPTPSSAVQSPTNVTEEQTRDWAPDRSPLQKLEVTLNDISKEEKRARVEEAEMLLRESKAGRGSRRTNRDIATGAIPVGPPFRKTSTRGSSRSKEPQNLEEAGLVRNLSTTQRDRLNHSTTIDARKPDVKRLSGEGRRGFDYQEQEYGANDVPPKRSSTKEHNLRHTSGNQQHETLRDGRLPSVRHKPDLESIPAAATQYDEAHANVPPKRRHQGFSEVPPQAQDRPQSYASSSRDRSHDRRVVSAQGADDPSAAARAVPSNTTRAVSMQESQPPAIFPGERELPRINPNAKEANSSHKAALAETAALGAAAAATVTAASRSNSRKLQKASPSGLEYTTPPTDGRLRPNESSGVGASSPQGPVQSGAQLTETTEAPRVESYQRVVPKQVSVQRSTSQRAPVPVGLGLQGPALDSQSDKYDSSDAQKPRRQSVSFKEPSDHPKPVNEWKDAGVARLALADMALGDAFDPKKDKAWWEAEKSSARRKSRRASAARTAAEMSYESQKDERPGEFNPPLFLKCGPLLRYVGMKRESASSSQTASSGVREIWRGTVLIVTADSHSSYESVPTLRLFSQPKKLLPPPPQEIAGEELAPEYVDPIAGLTKVSRTGKLLYVKPVDHLEQERDLSRIEDDNGLFEQSPSPLDINGSREATSAEKNRRTDDRNGERVGKFQEVRGVRMYADLIRKTTFWRFNLEVELGEQEEHIAYRINRGPPIGFWVPARGQSMNIMFHSCNGFSMSVNPDLFSGPDPLWRDVLNNHQTRPFHVMVGGGDQIYNDRVILETHHFGEWTKLRNPEHKHHAPFTREMSEELETFYLERYSMWFSQGLFGLANCQIPMVNMWDDHDIIDGFGSYPDHFMQSPVFAGLGNIAFKYYMLFQHHSVSQETTADEPSWLLGAKPGPYITQQSRSLFMHMGKHIAFLGLDCRTERKRNEVLTLATTDLVLERCRKEIVEGETKHLIVLVGIPIAYPRLVWLENVLTSRAMDPLKALGRMGVMKGLYNKFDGGVEILDDLDDHWTAKGHKLERNDLIHDLQDLAAEKSVRITILGGDVHLAAIGQFYSNPKLRIPKDKDHRYMPNVISSAIVNTPPPGRLADIMNKRNKVHHLDKYTDEDMIPMFTHDVDNSSRNNKRLLPRRNWCSIREYHPGSTPPPTPPDSRSISGSEMDHEETGGYPQRRFSLSRDANPRKLFRRISSRGTPSESPSISGSDAQEDARYPRRRFSVSRDVNPRNLFRRISGREAPPSSYLNSAYQQRPASHDGLPPPRGPNSNGNPSQPPVNSGDSQDPNDRRASFEQTSSGTPVRPPTFMRRTTNMSEKAARKGNVPALDAEGNEIDLSGHVNLQGGLDIILNVEVDQKDPSGITAPYRLLVPALQYDGSSDREKLDEPAAGLQRKPTLLTRFAGKRSNGNGPPQGNETGDDGSYSESEEEYEQRPRGILGLFSRRRKYDHYDDFEDDYHRPSSHQHDGNVAQQLSQPPPMMDGPPGRPTEGGQFSEPHHQGYPQPQMQQSQSYPSPQVQQDERVSQPQPVRGNGAIAPTSQSKINRVLGIGPGHDQPPPTQPLRGNGIIGRNYNPNYDGGPGGFQHFPGQGYSGIEAYESRPRRRGWPFGGIRKSWLGDGYQ